MPGDQRNITVVERKGGMKIDVHLLLPPRVKPPENAVEAMKNVSRIPSIDRAIGLPNFCMEG